MGDFTVPRPVRPFIAPNAARVALQPASFCGELAVPISYFDQLAPHNAELGRVVQFSQGCWLHSAACLLGWEYPVTKV